MRIRNFAIIAHVDHGKSTLADRFLVFCGAVSDREMRDQMLDSLDVERQRGITVKSQSVHLEYDYKGDKAERGRYILNLIDTPGHVDFSFEVQRALAACDGAIVLIDATQGVEAQTVANVYRAIENDVFLLPVINKVDLPSAQVEAVSQQIKEVLDIHIDPVLVSAKTGLGVNELLDRMIEMIPAPTGNQNGELRALLVDSWFDQYLGVVLLIRVKDGSIRTGQQFKFFSNGAVYRIEKLGYLTPKLIPTEVIKTGEVGVVIANVRKLKDCQIGDTIVPVEFHGEPLSRIEMRKAVVFCCFFPTDTALYPELKDALEKLMLNDTSLTIEPVHGQSIGPGFRCGFLGLLHLEVITQRLDQEFDMAVIVTPPNVEYIVTQTNGEVIKIHDANFMPMQSHIAKIEEPWVQMTVFSPEKYLGAIMQLCMSKRAEMIDVKYVNLGNVQNVTCMFAMPMNEIIFDFHDKLKSITQGYASFDYKETGYRSTEVNVVNILINGTKVDALSMIVHKDYVNAHARWMCEQLKEEIPRQQVAIAIQAAIGAKVIARESITAYRKDVTAKLYGGDRTRKMKLLEKQKAGKKRMEKFTVGQVELPPNVIINVLRKNRT